MDTAPATEYDRETAAFTRVDGPEAQLTLGRYKLGRRLGAGGFATVYAAHDERLDRPVAIKVLPRERVIHSRFEREARAAARLHHPGIVTLFEAAVDDEGAYLVSELVKGTTLDQALELGELSDRDILEAGIALADALDFAHANDVVHRDVKPQNVLIPAKRRTKAGGLSPAKLTDFGVAHVVGGDSLTRTGDVIGTLAYMSPEQAEGREVGPCADLYSLALVLYEALTGVNPLAAQLRQGSRRRLGMYLPPIRRQRGDLPRQLCGAIDLALRPRPSERGTLTELRMTLEDCLALVDDRAGVVAPAKAITIIRRGDTEETAVAGPGPGPAWEARPDRRPIPALEPTAQSRTQALALAPDGLLLAGLSLLAVALGAVGLAGAWPGVSTQLLRGWWRRGVAAGLGFLWLGVAGQLAPRNFYYTVPALTWVDVRPVLIAAGIWALAAGFGPLLVRGRHPALDLAAVTLVSALVPIAITSAGLHHVAGLVAGALVGWLIAAHRPLLGVIRQGIASRSLP